MDQHNYRFIVSHALEAGSAERSPDVSHGKKNMKGNATHPEGT